MTLMMMGRSIRRMQLTAWRPQASKYYGTNASGTPGIYDLPTGGGSGAIELFIEEVIAETTLADDTHDSITFDSIAADYVELRLVGELLATGYTYVIINLNDDATEANYGQNFLSFWAWDGTENEFYFSGNDWAVVGGMRSTPIASLETKFSNPSSTSQHKHYKTEISQTGEGGSSINTDYYIVHSLWKSASRITKIKISVEGGYYWSSGTHVKLIGKKLISLLEE